MNKIMIDLSIRIWILENVDDGNMIFAIGNKV
jgi:hypothetical protein